MNEKKPEQIDRAQILRLSELVREQAEQSYNADRPLTFSEMELISRSCDEIGREISKPERQHGRWIPLDSKTAKCSCCGWWQHAKTYHLPDDIIAFSCCYRFCTACGARMDGVKSSGKD